MKKHFYMSGIVLFVINVGISFYNGSTAIINIFLGNHELAFVMVLFGLIHCIIAGLILSSITKYE